MSGSVSGAPLAVATGRPPARELTFDGTVLSPGFGLGRAFVYLESGPRAHELCDPGPHEVEQEYARIQAAHEHVLAELARNSAQLARGGAPALAEIFGAHELILNDPSIWSEFKGELERTRVNAALAVRRVYGRWQRRLRALEHRPTRLLAEDLADLCGKVLRALAGVTTHALAALPAGSVLVARRLLPSDTMYLSRETTAGIAVQAGGAGSHAALLAVHMGLPTVFSPGMDLEAFQDGASVLVDGLGGKVVLDPSPRTVREARQQHRSHQRQERICRPRRHEAAITADSVEVAVMANIGCREDAAAAADNGADGVGLFRIEHLYLSRGGLLDEDELLTALAHALRPMAQRQVTVRLLDLGGDKVIPDLSLAEESDPLLGRRGIRVLLEHPDLLTTQLRALLRLAARVDLRILVPMVTFAEEMQAVRRYVEETAAELGIGGAPPLGAMIETPAAALCVDDISVYADFLSVGTNDLAQYTLAAGRENPQVGSYYQDSHKAIYRLLAHVVEHAGDRQLSICGQLAGRPAQVPALLQLGVTSLSVAPGLVPRIKQAVREAAARAA